MKAQSALVGERDDPEVHPSGEFYELCVRRKKLQVFELWISWRV